MNCKKCVISMSGGLDSTCLALKMLAEGKEVRAYAFQYGQKHQIELVKLQKNIKILQDKKLPISLNIINLKSAFSDSASSLCSADNSNGDIPKGDYGEENMKSTVVENRNIIFSAIIYGKALGWANKTKENVEITLGIHAGDHCFTEDTKILTPEGYKTIKTLKVGDNVYSLNTETGEMMIDRCLDIIEKGSNDEIYNIKTTAGTVRLTAEHKVFVMEFGKYTNSGFDKRIISKKVKDLKEGDIMLTSYKTPVEENINLNNKTINISDIIKPILEETDKYIVEDIDGMTNIKLKSLNRNLTPYKTNMPAKELLNIMAWYITEGWSSKEYLKNEKASRFQSSFSQSAYKNIENCISIENDMKTLGIKESVSYSKEMINNRPIEVAYSFNSAISTLMQTCGSSSTDKHIPDWIMNFLKENKSYIFEFVNTMVAGDGHYNNISGLYSYISNSKQLIEDMSYLIKMIGYYVKINYPNNQSNCYTITFGNKDRKTGLVRFNDAAMTKVTSIKIEHKLEKVYDISVEHNHNFFAGDFGSILISNSLYPDTTKESQEAAKHCFEISNWGSERVDYRAPFVEITKDKVLKEGLNAMRSLGFKNEEINEVLKNTHSCYDPDEKGRSCGCCGTCKERINSFIINGLKDPVEYQVPIKW